MKELLKPKFSYLGALAIAILGGFAGGSAVYTYEQWQNQSSIPGGVWRGAELSESGNSQFEADAYTANSHVGIDYVNFTYEVDGNWYLACRVDDPVVSNTYSCEENLSDVWEEGQQVEISFDVVDTKGNLNQSPNGTRLLTVQP